MSERLPVTVAIGDAATISADTRRLVADHVTASLRAMIAEAAIDDIVNIDVVVVDGEDACESGPIGLRIGRRRAWFNAEDIIPITAEAFGGQATPTTDHVAAFAADPRTLAAWCTEVCSVAARSNLDLFLPEPVTGPAGIEPTHARALRKVLRIGRSLGDWRELTAHLYPDSDVELAERIIAASPPEQLLIRLSEDRFDDLLPALDAYPPGAGPLAAMRHDLGARFGFDPSVSVRLDRTLPPQTFRVSAGLRWAALRKGVPADHHVFEGAAFEPAEFAQIRLPGGRGKLGLVVPDGRAPEVWGTSWDPPQYLAVAALIDACAVASALVDADVTHALLLAVGAEHEVLARLLRDSPGVDQLTAALRQLVVAGLPINDGITLQAALVAGATDELVTRLRLALRFRVLDRVSEGSQVLPTYLLDPALDEPISLMADDQMLEDAVVASVATEIAKLQTGVRRPAILTTNALATPLRDLFARRFPLISIVTHDELPAEALVRPIARIGIPTDVTSR